MYETSKTSFVLFVLYSEARLLKVIEGSADFVTRRKYYFNWVITKLRVASSNEVILSADKMMKLLVSKINEVIQKSNKKKMEHMYASNGSGQREH